MMRSLAYKMVPGQTAILTYHRVVSGSSRVRMSDVSLERFRDQMSAIGNLQEKACGEYDMLTNGQQIVISFDDGDASHLAASSVLEEFGLRGLFFVISDRLGQDEYLTSEQVAEMAARGHRIGSHTCTHRRLDRLSPQEIADECSLSRRKLEDLTGSTIQWFAFPGGYHDAVSAEAAFAAGYKAVRTMEWGYASAGLTGLLPALPVTGFHTATRFQRILDGKAPMWPYHLKKLGKMVLPEAFYGKMRDRIGAKGE